MKCSAEGCDREAAVKCLCQRHYMRMRRYGRLTTVRHVGKFWEKVQKGDPKDCWPWLGYQRTSGHGLTMLEGMPIHTSKKAWILTHGPVPDGLHVLHKCDNAVCCNPKHLYLGTPIDNAIDTHTRRPFEERVSGSQQCKLTDEQLEKLWQRRRGGATLRACASEFNIHIQTVIRYVTRMRLQKINKLRADRLALQNSPQRP